MELYLVISQEACGARDFLEVAKEAILGGVDTIQLREKSLDHAEFVYRARALHQITLEHNVPLIINDNLEVALEMGAEGIHVGLSDLPPGQIRGKWKGIIGWSIEYLNQLDSPEIQYTDYVAASPVFSTPTKTDTVTEWGIEGIRKIKSLTSLPLVAIGNVNANNARKILDAGADSLAVVSAICQAEHPRKAASQLKYFFHS
jgi:thiamine-phosphate pyrophosphorylase